MDGSLFKPRKVQASRYSQPPSHSSPSHRANDVHLNLYLSPSPSPPSPHELFQHGPPPVSKPKMTSPCLHSSKHRKQGKLGLVDIWIFVKEVRHSPASPRVGTGTGRGGLKHRESLSLSAEVVDWLGNGRTRVWIKIICVYVYVYIYCEIEEYHHRETVEILSPCWLR
jgi:hypothetical protein